ncbi:MAG: amidase [Chloroflexi bacterium]|nr:amidase [Chloroflexota bacterium]
MAKPGTPELARLTVVELASSIAQGELTPSEVAEAYLGRIDLLEDRVQAWSHLDPDSVRADAAILTAEAARGQFRGPLHGIPIGIKDEFHMAGLVTQMAGPEIQREDAAAITRLRAAGALIMGKTHMPIDGVNPPTRNPWNLAHTPGGTSSGSGAAVSARMVPVALGEQTAGSNLRPAAFCGIDAFKPTFGRISRFGVYPFSYSHDHVGIIGLTMADVALVFSLLAGPDPRDPTTLPEPAPPADLEVETMRPPRVGVIRNFFPEHTEPVMHQAIEAAVARFRTAGAEIRDVFLPPDFATIWAIHRLVGGVEALSIQSGRSASDPGLSRSASAVANSLIPASYYVHAQRLRRHLHTEVQGVFTEVDALLLSVAPGAAPKGLDSTGDTTMLRPWSCLGYPAITVNGGLSPDDLPLGLQLVGRPMADYQLLRVGAWAESVLGRLPSPPIG